MTVSEREAEIAYAGVVGQAGMLRDQRLRAVELVDLLLRRIARLDPQIRAFRLLLADEARAAAQAADDARASGDTRPLLGVPIAVKDTAAVRGTAALMGTASPEPVAGDDDELVRRLREAGMVILGKTNLPELALWAVTESAAQGITHNPWDHRYSPGGSSGGSAAAVAAGMVPAAHATDGLGSIRIPASACGLVGLKPTHGLVPLAPDPEHWNGMSHAGFVTRSVRDTATLLETVVPQWSAVPERPSAALRIAVTTRSPVPTPVAAEVRRCLDQALDTLAALGHRVTMKTPPYGPALAAANAARYLTGVAEDVDRLADPSAVEPRTRALAAMGRRLPVGAAERARRVGAEFGERMAAMFTEVDLLVTPTMPVLPRRAGILTGRGVTRTLATMLPCAAYTGPWNSCGLPAVSLPVGWSQSGLPIGIQLIGPRGSDPQLLTVAAALESRLGWLDRRASTPARQAATERAAT